MNCPCGFDPSVQRITVGGSSVGIVGLEDIFRNWLAAGKRAPDLPKDVIVQEIRKHNHIVRQLEGEYAEAVRTLYASQYEKSL